MSERIPTKAQGREQSLLNSFEPRIVIRFSHWVFAFVTPIFRCTEIYCGRLSQGDRSSHMATLKKARQHKVHTVFSKAEPDKLYIGGKFWPVGKPFDIEELDS